MARKKYNGDVTEEFDTNVILDAYHQQEKMDKIASTVKSIIIEVGVSVLIVFLFVTCLFRPVMVSGTSMYPTLRDREFGFSNIISKNLFGIDRDDIVIIKTDGKYIIKRVIGLPGEHVEIKDNKVYINGTELEESYLDSSVVTTACDGAFTDLIVPDGYIFAMGDNRPQSTDCRSFGCIPISKIEGKVAFRFWPLSTWGNPDKK